MRYDYSTVFGTKKLVIFDIDGTLVDTLSLHYDITMEAFQLHGDLPTIQRELIREHAGKPAEKYTRGIFQSHGIDNPDSQKIQRIIQHHHEKMMIEQERLTHEHTIKGVVPLLTRLIKDGKQLATITGNVRRTGQKILQSTQLQNFFQVNVYSDDLYNDQKIHSKKEMVYAVIEQMKKKGLKLTPEEVIVVGDTPYDIQAAHEAGVDSIGVGTGSHTKDEILTKKPTFWVDHF